MVQHNNTGKVKMVQEDLSNIAEGKKIKHIKRDEKENVEDVLI